MGKVVRNIINSEVYGSLMLFQITLEKTLINQHYI